MNNYVKFHKITYILHIKFLRIFPLCFHNSCEIWHSFSWTPMRNFLCCYYRLLLTSLALEKCKKNAMFLKLFCRYKVFVHWELKLLSFLVDSYLNIPFVPIAQILRQIIQLKVYSEYFFCLFSFSPFIQQSWYVTCKRWNVFYDAKNYFEENNRTTSVDHDLQKSCALSGITEKYIVFSKIYFILSKGY